MKVGSGSADITPDVGIPLSGFAIRRNRPSVAIDDPLSVKVIAIKDHKALYLLLSYDLVSLGKEEHKFLDDKLREELKDEYRSDRVVITATHTHSGPPTNSISGEDHIPDQYRNYIGQATLSAAREAINNLDEAILYHFETELKNLTINRRFELWSRAKGEGPSDPEHKSKVDNTFDLFVFKNTAEQNLASCVRFACHGVTMLTQHISADFPGELTRRLSKELGVPCLFLQGTAGDVDPVVRAEDHAAMLGFVNNLMGQIGDFQEHLKEVPVDTIESKEGSIALEYAPFPARDTLIEQIAKHERIFTGDLTSPDLQDLVHEYSEWRYPTDKDLDQNVRHWGDVFKEVYSRTLAAVDNPSLFPPVPFRIVIWKLGTITFVFLAGEILTSIGEHIKVVHPDRNVQVISFLSPIVGYICDPEDYKVGGYEPKTAWMWYRLPGSFKEDIETDIVKKVNELLSKVKSYKS
jgi:hypothetical protein